MRSIRRAVSWMRMALCPKVVYSSVPGEQVSRLIRAPGESCCWASRGWLRVSSSAHSPLQTFRKGMYIGENRFGILFGEDAQISPIRKIFVQACRGLSAAGRKAGWAVRPGASRPSMSSCANGRANSYCLPLIPPRTVNRLWPVYSMTTLSGSPATGCSSADWVSGRVWRQWSRFLPQHMVLIV